MTTLNLRLVAFCGLSLLLNLNAQAHPAPKTGAEDENIVIKNKTESYEFIEGKADNPVLIKETKSTVFRCDGFRSSMPFVEFYDDESTIDDVSVYVNGRRNKSIAPQFEYYSVESIFYSDARVCYFSLPLEKKGAESSVELTKTIKDPRYFTTIYFSEAYKVESQEIQLIVPDWMHIAIKELNFEGYSISKQTEQKGNTKIYRYKIQQLPARKSESRSPGPSYIYPHLLILSQYAELSGKKLTYFNTVADQYAWYRQLVLQIGSDKQVIKEKAAEIVKGMKTDLEKQKAIYKYVQDNIRYIAFEDGIAGFKPEKADQVLKKKYGDCKGMANLTKELLVAAGFDARLCWIGTNHIAYDYTTPSLSVDNHMICALQTGGKFRFLDATETYIGFDQYAERIQGRPVLIEDGEKYMLDHVPARLPDQNTDYEKRIVRIDGTALIGKATHTLIGESKEWLLTQIHSLKKDKLSVALQSYLSEQDNKYAITDLQTSDLNERNNSLDISYQVDHKEAVAGFGNDLYVDLDLRKDLVNNDIDVSKRKTDWLFPYKQHLVYETELTIPADYNIAELPAGLTVEDPNYQFRISYKQEGGKILYRKEISIKDTRLKKAAFEKWNKSIAQLKKCYNEQVTLVKK
ncbi:MAG TPA: transglutaminase domain-containing protein [Flavihumibacter sp.]|nr:transglutaminase domain-containing protein [Flavihumibacter sp.]